MAGGPPSSSVDRGDAYGDSSYFDGSVSTSSLTYYERIFGPGGMDPSSFIPDYTTTDKVLAMVRLIFGASFFILGTYALVRFYRSRWVLDIRTRSAYLVMFGGFCILLTMLININAAVSILWGEAADWFYSSLVLFFVAPAFLWSYICRALRLAVVFHPKAKRALPWLVPERNYVIALLVGSFSMLAIPIYHEYTLTMWWEIVPKQMRILAWISTASAVVLACLYPFIRKVDDLFNISKELIGATVIALFYAIGQVIVVDYGSLYIQRWLGDNISGYIAACLFYFSVMDPLRRLATDPLAATKQNYADRVLLARSDETRSSTARSAERPSSGIGGDSENEAKLEGGRPSKRPATTRRSDGGIEHGNIEPLISDSASAATTTDVVSISSTVPDNCEIVGRASAHEGGRENGGGGGGRGRGVGDDMEVWDFERLGRTPLLAAAFEDFSRKALCHESVLFLSEVSRYQNDDFEFSAASPPTQFGMFCYITNTFIKSGSIEEVNISDADKKKILDLHHKGRASFETVREQERRTVFTRAYVEVRQMLEANLLGRFLRTDQFKNVRMQRENLQAMMDSPQR